MVVKHIPVLETIDESLTVDFAKHPKLVETVMNKIPSLPIVLESNNDVPSNTANEEKDGMIIEAVLENPLVIKPSTVKLDPSIFAAISKRRKSYSLTTPMPEPIEANNIPNTRSKMSADQNQSIPAFNLKFDPSFLQAISKRRKSCNLKVEVERNLPVEGIPCLSNNEEVLTSQIIVDKKKFDTNIFDEIKKRRRSIGMAISNETAINQQNDASTKTVDHVEKQVQDTKSSQAKNLHSSITQAIISRRKSYSIPPPQPSAILNDDIPVPVEDVNNSTIPPSTLETTKATLSSKITSKSPKDTKTGLSSNSSLFQAIMARRKSILMVPSDLLKGTTPSKNKTPSKTPSKIPSKTPVKTPSKTPAKTPTATPARTPVKTPTKTYVKSTVKTPLVSSSSTNMEYNITGVAPTEEAPCVHEEEAVEMAVPVEVDHTMNMNHITPVKSDTTPSKKRTSSKSSAKKRKSMENSMIDECEVIAVIDVVEAIVDDAAVDEVVAVTEDVVDDVDPVKEEEMLVDAVEEETGSHDAILDDGVIADSIEEEEAVVIADGVEADTIDTATDEAVVSDSIVEKDVHIFEVTMDSDPIVEDTVTTIAIEEEADAVVSSEEDAAVIEDTDDVAEEALVINDVVEGEVVSEDAVETITEEVAVVTEVVEENVIVVDAVLDATVGSLNYESSLESSSPLRMALNLRRKSDQFILEDMVETRDDGLPMAIELENEQSAVEEAVVPVVGKKLVLLSLFHTLNIHTTIDTILPSVIDLESNSTTKIPTSAIVKVTKPKTYLTFALNVGMKTFKIHRKKAVVPLYRFQKTSVAPTLVIESSPAETNAITVNPPSTEGVIVDKVVDEVVESMEQPVVCPRQHHIFFDNDGNVDLDEELVVSYRMSKRLSLSQELFKELSEDINQEDLPCSESMVYGESDMMDVITSPSNDVKLVIDHASDVAITASMLDAACVQLAVEAFANELHLQVWC